jgi:hypothetical protein
MTRNYLLGPRGRGLPSLNGERIRACSGSGEDMIRGSRINYTNSLVLTASRQAHPLDLPMFYILGIGSPDRRPLTTGVQLRLPVKYTVNAIAELLPDDFVRLRLLSPSYFHCAPGQTAYLIILSVSCLSFAHPFTVASIDSKQFHVLEELEPRLLRLASRNPFAVLVPHSGKSSCFSF